MIKNIDKLKDTLNSIPRKIYHESARTPTIVTQSRFAKGYKMHPCIGPLSLLAILPRYLDGLSRQGQRKSCYRSDL